MPKICYTEKVFAKASLARIEVANRIIAEYQAAGFDLTLRQLYYQFVSRDLLPNTQKSYKALGALLADARLAGLVDWNAITDRTRYVRRLSTWDSPKQIVEGARAQYRRDLWETQPARVEVWIEKDALVGVFQGACNELQVPLFSCRGYTSASEMWSAAQRLIGYAQAGQEAVVLHFGDHDPSGLDMTRDIDDRLTLFCQAEGVELEIERVALTMAQVRKHKPPPNPAKVTDSRFDAYRRQHGDKSWELDALDPKTLAGLVRAKVSGHLDDEAWDKALEQQERERDRIRVAVEAM